MIEQAKLEEYEAYIGIEEGLKLAHKQYISVDKNEATENGKIVLSVVRTLIELMLRESPAFKALYSGLFLGGSCYDALKITDPNEFDIDILLRIPKETRPILYENNKPGYVNLQLSNFDQLAYEKPILFRAMEKFVDEKNYLLAKKMKEGLMQSLFQRTVKRYLPKNYIQVEGVTFTIKMKSLGPALTLTLKGQGMRLFVDLVPCILLDGSYWPGQAFKPNPYMNPDDFFLVPKSPKEDTPHIDRYWRLSFQKQEENMIHDRKLMKPTIRILKRLRDCLGHKVSSYALKTIFFHELAVDNPELDDETPELWSGPFSFCVIHMLEVYLRYLKKGMIPYFWNKKLDLLDNLSENQVQQYAQDVEDVLEDIKDEPWPETVFKYLKCY